MPWTTWADEQGLIWAKVSDDRHGFNEALADSVSALSPLGQAPALSTYWIDEALTGVEIGGGKPFLVGNATRLARDGEEVVAQSSYELFEDERMPVRDFVEGLQLWRAAVVTGIRTKSAISLPPGATYWAQRNPYP